MGLLTVSELTRDIIAARFVLMLAVILCVRSAWEIVILLVTHGTRKRVPSYESPDLNGLLRRVLNRLARKTMFTNAYVKLDKPTEGTLNFRNCTGLRIAFKRQYKVLILERNPGPFAPGGTD